MKLIAINKNLLVNPRHISAIEKSITGQVSVTVYEKTYKMSDKSEKAWQKLLDDIELVPEQGQQQYFSG